MSGVGRQGATLLDIKLLYVVCCMVIITGSVETPCNGSSCMVPENTFIERPLVEPGTCINDTLPINITCTRGFQHTNASYQAVCNDKTGEWVNNGSCDIDVLSVIIAAIAMLAIVAVFGLCIIFLCKRGRTKRRKSMYDTSLDTSEVIDGHHEEGGVVNIIILNEIQPSPRVIPIEDQDEMDDEAGNTTSSDTTVPVDVHASSEFAQEDMLDGYGVIEDNPLTPADPQAGSSTENLLDMTRDEPDGQANLEPEAIVDRSLARNRNSETTLVGGSVKVRPVTTPPLSVFTKRSASVQNHRPKDSEAGVDALYAKINWVKRASSRWPPGQKDQKPAVSTDGWNHIDNEQEKYPTEPATGERIKEDMYAEVDHRSRNSVRSSKEDPSTTSKKIPPKVAKKPTSQKIKHYTPPSGDHSALYARVDRGSRHSSKSSILDNDFDPPSPPPIDGVKGLYAQIDRDRNSKEDLTKVGADDDHVKVERQ